ncbi:hypothetical protein As57867_004070, partial [Aphanomyces stellatus]
MRLLGNGAATAMYDYDVLDPSYDLEDGELKKKLSSSSSFFTLWRIRLPLLWGLWALVFAWGELGASRLALSSCNWTGRLPNEFHLAVVADPQLTDYYSYDMVKGSWALWLTEFYSDVYMRRHFQLLARKGNVHGVILLGDLFDGGRILTLEEHAIHMRRFEWIFGGHHPQIQFWNMSGNHDVGIRRWNNHRANSLHRDAFGLTQ